MQQGQPVNEGETSISPPPPSLRLHSVMSRPSSSSSLFAPLGTRINLASTLGVTSPGSSPLGAHMTSPSQNVNFTVSCGRPLSPLNLRERSQKLSPPNSTHSSSSPSFRGGQTPSPRIGSDPNAAHDIADLAISAVALAEQQNIQSSRYHFLRHSRERGRGSSSGLSTKGSGSGISASAEQVIDSVVEAFLSCGGGGCGEGHCCSSLSSTSCGQNNTSLAPENFAVGSTLSRTNSPSSPCILQANMHRSGTPVSDSDDDDEVAGTVCSKEVLLTSTQDSLFLSSSVSDERIENYKFDVNLCNSANLLALLANRRDRLKSSAATLRRPERSPTEIVKKGGKDWKDGCKCEECGKLFSISNRRHHCRACGSILCKPCVPYRNFELRFESKASSRDVSVGGDHIKSLKFSRLCLRCHALACGRVFPPRRSRSNGDEKTPATRNYNSDEVLSWLDCIASCDAHEVDARIQLGQDVNATGCISVDGVAALHIAVGIPAFAETATSHSLSVNSSKSELIASGNTSGNISSPEDKPKCASVGFCLSSIPELIGNFLGKRSTACTQDVSPFLISSSTSLPELSAKSIPSNGGNMYLSCSTSSEAERSLFSILHSLIQAGADVHAVTNSKRTPLHCAAAFGTPRIVEFLLANGAMQYAVDKNGFTAFDYAQMRAARGDVVGRCILLDGLLTSTSSNSSLLVEHATRLSRCEADTAARKRLAVKIHNKMALDKSMEGIIAISRREEEEEETKTNVKDAVLHSSSVTSALVTLDSLMTLNKSRSEFNPLSVLGTLPTSQDSVIKRAVELSRLEPLPPLRSAQVSSLNIKCLAQAAQDLQRNLVSVRNGHERFICERLWPLLLCDKSEKGSFSRIRESSFLVRAAHAGLISRRNVLSLLSPKLGDLSVHSSALIGQVWLLGHKLERNCEGKGLSVGIALAERAERRLEEIQGDRYVRPIGLRSDKDEEEDMEEGEAGEHLRPLSINPVPKPSLETTTSIPPPMISQVLLSNTPPAATHANTAPLLNMTSPSVPSHGLRISIQRSATAPTDSKSLSSIAMARRPVQSLPNIRRTHSLVNDSDEICGSSVEFPIMNRLTASSGASIMPSLVGLTLNMPRLRIPQDPEFAAHFRAKELEKELEKERLRDTKTLEFDKERIREWEDKFADAFTDAPINDLRSSDSDLDTDCNLIQTIVSDAAILKTVTSPSCEILSTARISEVFESSLKLPLSPLTLKIRAPLTQEDVVDEFVKSSSISDTQIYCGVSESELSSIVEKNATNSQPLPLNITNAILSSRSGIGRESIFSSIDKEEEGPNSEITVTDASISSSSPSFSTVRDENSFVASSSPTTLFDSHRISGDTRLDGKGEKLKEKSALVDSSLSSIRSLVGHSNGHSFNSGHHAHGHRGHKHHHGHRLHVRQSFVDAITANHQSDPLSSTSAIKAVPESGCIHRHSFHGWLHGGRSKPFLRHGSEGDGVAALAPKSCLKSHSSTGRVNKLEGEASAFDIDHQQQLYQAAQMLEIDASKTFPIDGSPYVHEIDPQGLDSTKLSTPAINSRSESPMLTSLASPPSSLSSRSSSIGVDDGQISVETFTICTSSDASITGLSVESGTSDPRAMSSSLVSSSSTTTSTSWTQPSLLISLPTLKSQQSYGNDGMLPLNVPPSPSLSHVSCAGSGRNGSGGSFFFSNLDQAAPSSPSNSIDNASTSLQGLSPNDSPVLRSGTGPSPSQFPSGLLLAEVRSRAMSEFSISSVTSAGVRPSRSVSFLDFEPTRDVIVFKPTSLIAPQTDGSRFPDSAESGGESSAGESSATPSSSGVSDDDAFAEEMDDEDDEAYYSSARSDQSIDGSAADDDDGELADRSDAGNIESTYSHHIESGLGGRLGKVMHHNTRQRHGKGEGKVKKEEANMRVSSLVRSFSATSTTTSTKAISSSSSRSPAPIRRRSGSPIANAGGKTARAAGGGGSAIYGGHSAPHRRIAAARNASDVEKQRGGHGYHHILVSTTKTFSTLDSDSDDGSEGGYGSDDDSDGGCGAPIATASRASLPPSNTLDEQTLVGVNVHT